MDKKHRKRVTSKQVTMLCEFFEENPEVIRGYKKKADNIEAVQAKWKQITPQLNTLGPTKSHKAWAKYLCDIKAKLKRKRIKWRQRSDGVGPLICNAEEFSEICLRMLQVLRKDTLENFEESHNLDEDGHGDDPSNNEHYETGDYNTSEYQINNHEIKSAGNETLEIKIHPTEVCETAGKPTFISNDDVNDEFDAFGRNIAQQLRTLPLPIALETQETFMSVLRKQRLRILNESVEFKDPLEKVP